MIQPIGRNVLIKPDAKPAETVSDGGIVLPGSSNERPAEIAYGEIIAVGSGGYASAEWDGNIHQDLSERFVKPDPELVGKRCMYRNLLSHSIQHEGESFEVIDVDGIVALQLE